MHEHVFSALALNESETLGGIKPLHYTLLSQLLYFLLFDRINFYSENSSTSLVRKLVPASPCG
jgi:hypothetical protein